MHSRKPPLASRSEFTALTCNTELLPAGLRWMMSPCLHQRAKFAGFGWPPTSFGKSPSILLAQFIPFKLFISFSFCWTGFQWIIGASSEGQAELVMSAQVRKWNIYSDWCGVFLGLQDNVGECRFCDETLYTACLRQCGSNGFICPSS